MNLNVFQQLYASTYKPEYLLAAFWTVAIYDLEGRSFSVWLKTKTEIEENAVCQRGLLKNLFDQVFPASLADAAKIENFSADELAKLLMTYPALLVGNDEKLSQLIKELPEDNAVGLRALLVD